MKYVVVAVTLGDGETNFGRRLFSQEFSTRDAAEACASFLRRGDTEVTVIEDGVEA